MDRTNRRPADGHLRSPRTSGFLEKCTGRRPAAGRSAVPRRETSARKRWGSFSTAAFATLMLAVMGSVASFSPSTQAAGCCRLAFERSDDIPHAGEQVSAALSPDGKHLYQSLGNHSGDNGLRVLSVAKNGKVRPVEIQTEAPATVAHPSVHNLRTGEVLISPDGRHVYLASASAIYAFTRNSRSGRLRLVQRLAVPVADAAAAFDSAGLHLYVVGKESGNISAVRALLRNRRTGALSLIDTYPADVGNATVRDIALSPDGKNVYLASDSADKAVVFFDRESRTGELSNSRFLAHQDGVVDGLTSAHALLIDENGRDLYVADRLEGTLAHYHRDANGDLTLFSALGDHPDEPSLRQVHGLAISPDGESMMVMQGLGFVVLERSQNDGSLRYVETLSSGMDEINIPFPDANTLIRPRMFLLPNTNRYLYLTRTVSGLIVDREFSPSPRLLLNGPAVRESDILPGGGIVTGLERPNVVRLSPDDRHLYVASEGTADSNVVQVFEIDAATGDLTPIQIISDDNVPGDELNLLSVLSLRLSPDGRFLYALGYGPNDRDDFLATVTVLERDLTTGTLSAVESYTQGTAGIDGLLGARELRISPDGSNLYVVGARDNSQPEGTIGVFGRDAVSGELQFLEVIENFDGPIVITNPHDLTFSPDGRLVYVGAGGRFALSEGARHALSVFRRLADGTLEHIESLEAPGNVVRTDSLAVTPDAKFLYALQNNGFTFSTLTVFTLDRRTGLPSYAWSGTRGLGQTIGVSDDAEVHIIENGKRLLVGGSEFNGVGGRKGAIAVIARNTKTGALLLEDGAEPSRLGLQTLPSFAVDSTGQKIYGVDRYDKAVRSFYFASGPVFTGPREGAVLTGPEMTLRWMFNGSKGKAVRITVANATDGTELFNRRLGASARSVKVRGLPLDGRALHLSITAGDSTDERTVTAATAPDPAIVAPVADTNLPPGTVLFEWSHHGHTVQSYELLVGTAGSGVADDLFRRRFTAKTRKAKIKNLPQDGRAIVVTLVSHLADGTVETANAYRAGLPAPKFAHASGREFRWTDHGGADQYRLIVGSVPGGDELCDSGPLNPDVLTFTCFSFPDDGRELFAQLLRTAGPVTTVHPLVVAFRPPRPTLSTPQADSTLPGHTVNFQLDRKSHTVKQWELRVGTRRGKSDLFRARLPGEEFEIEVTGLPTTGETVFARLVVTTVDGKRSTEDLEFTGVTFASMPRLTRPSQLQQARAILDGTPIEFRWNDGGHHISAWRLDFGTSPGASDFGSVSSDEPNTAVSTSAGPTNHTSIEVTGLPFDTTVHARWTVWFGHDARSLTEQMSFIPTPSACCSVEVGPALSEGGVGGLNGTSRVLVSPDGVHVYTVSSTHELGIFSRNTNPGSPDFGALTPIHTDTLSYLPRDFAISPDGTRLYVLSFGRIEMFVRDPATGLTTPAQVLDIAASRSVAVGPDGRYLYAVGGNSLDIIAISGTDGSLSLVDTLVAGTDHAFSDDFDRIVALGAGGELVDLYLTSRSDNSLAGFRHDRSTDAVTPIGELVDGSADVDGLSQAAALLPSADGAFVTVNGAGDNSLAVFSRDAASGALTFQPDLLLPNSVFTSAGQSAIVAAPDDQRLYLINRHRTGVTVHDRDTSTGEVGDLTGGGSFGAVEVQAISMVGVHLAVSPDGEHLYVLRNGDAGDLDAGISVFAIDPTAGTPNALVLTDVLKNSNQGIDGLEQLTDIATDTMGQYVYAVGREHKMTVLERHLDTNEFTQVQVLRQDDAGLHILYDPTSVALSPDLNHVYVGARAPSGPDVGGGIVRFERDRATSRITFAGRTPYPTFPLTSLESEVHIGMSADGRYLYAVGRRTNSVSVYSREPQSGELTLVGTLRQGTEVNDGLASPDGIYVGLDGRNVYVLSSFESTVTSFQRNANTGRLTFIAVARNVIDNVDTQLITPIDLALSADNRDAYVLGGHRRSVVHFKRRASDGRLDYVETTSVGALGGLTDAAALAFDASGTQLLFAGDDGIATLGREPGDGTLVLGPVRDMPAPVLVTTGSDLSSPFIIAEPGQVSTLRQAVRIESPAAGASFAAQTATVHWSANGLPATGWRLQLGSTPGGRDLCDSRHLARAARAFTCEGLPREGESIFATLTAEFGTSSSIVTRTFFAPTLGLPFIASPAPGLEIGGDVTFDLDPAGNDISRWVVRIGKAPGGRELFNRSLAGNATSFDVRGLPADVPVFVSIEARGTFGRQTTVYEYNPSPFVEPLFPKRGAGWGDYVRANKDGSASDRACNNKVPGNRAACLHAGELRQFVVPELRSCDGVSASDALDAFEWTCSEAMQPVRMVSTGLKSGRGLADLVNFSAETLHPNSLTVQHGASTTSGESVWWHNPVVRADGGGRLADVGTIYLAGNAQPSDGYSLEGAKLSLVVDPSIVLGAPVNPADAVIRLLRADFAWVEGRIDATGAAFGIQVNRGAWPILHQVTVGDADATASSPFALSERAGIAVSRARNLELREVVTDNTGDAGVVFERVSGSRVRDVRTSRAGHGVVLVRSSGNRLERIHAATTSLEGITLAQGSSNNVLAELVATNGAGEGIAIAGGSNGNHLFQLLALRNGGSGILIEEASGNLLMGVSAVGNTLDGVELLAAQRTALLQLALHANAGDGIASFGSSNSRIHDLASDGQGGAALRFEEGSKRNRITGILAIGSHGSVETCVADVTSTGIPNGCDTSALPDITLTAGISLAESFLGQMFVDDTENPDDTAGSAPFDSIGSWTTFDTPWRGWGSENADGPCNPSETCAIHDARLTTNDTGNHGTPALANRFAPPTPGDEIVHRLVKKVRPLPHARERLDLGSKAGDGDGLCEANEHCLLMPHLGAFQGQGTLVPTAPNSNFVQHSEATQEQLNPD